MVQSFNQNERFQIRDMFEIKEEWSSDHEPGLVVVLDQRLHAELADLIGEQAVVYKPDGTSLRVEIDEAQDHLTATSLFFKNKRQDDIPTGSQVMIEYPTK